MSSFIYLFIFIILYDFEHALKMSSGGIYGSLVGAESLGSVSFKEKFQKSDLMFCKNLI